MLGRLHGLRRLSGLALRRRIVLAAGVVLVVLAVTAIVIADHRQKPPLDTAPARALDRQIVAYGQLGTFRFRFPDADLPPVVLVPGYGDGEGSLDELAQTLEFTGRFATVLHLPDGGTGDLNVQAEALQRLVSRFRHKPVDVIGYSAGGVVVRLWLAKYGGAGEVRHVVTLGSPLHGAAVAGVGEALVPSSCAVACQQLAPGSVLLRTLDATPLPKGVQWMSIWTANDRTVDPPDSARLTSAINVQLQDICPRVRISHSGLPDAALVGGLVSGALGRGSITAPTPADCRTLQRQSPGIIFINPGGPGN
jgi:triacylglycerol esterase/lipase EstA (alpha/beta hydrolase family)